MPVSLKILLIGHAVNPLLGSEPGFTWNWAWHLAAHHKVVCVSYPQYKKEVINFLKENPHPNLEFVWLTLPQGLDPWDPAKGERGLRLHYIMWQRAVFKKVARLHAIHNFNIAHQVSLGTLSVPPHLWRLNIPFVWGPIGGGQISPRSFRKYYGATWIKEELRNFRIKLLPLMPNVRRACRASELVLVTNKESYALIKRSGARHVQLLLDAGLSGIYSSLKKRAETDSDIGGKELVLLWAGRHEDRKGLPLALEALRKITDVDVRLIVAGDGTRRSDWEAIAKQYALNSKVDFIGTVPYEKMGQLFSNVDAFIFTSLRDSFGSVVLEAMAHELPVITLDHQGVGTFVPDAAGIKVPVTTPEETIVKLSDAIRRLALFPQEREKAGTAAQEFARKQTWEGRARQMVKWYEEICFNGGALFCGSR